MFYLPLFNSVAPPKKYSQAEKVLGGYLHPPPHYAYVHAFFYCVILVNNNICFLMFKNVFQDCATENNSLLQGQCILSMTAVLLQAFEKVRRTQSRQMLLVTVIVREYWNAVVRMPILRCTYSMFTEALKFTHFVVLVGRLIAFIPSLIETYRFQ